MNISRVIFAKTSEKYLFNFVIVVKKISNIENEKKKFDFTMTLIEIISLTRKILVVKWINGNFLKWNMLNT